MKKSQQEGFQAGEEVWQVGCHGGQGWRGEWKVVRDDVGERASSRHTA